MATATELVKECQICALTFVNPKLLPCHHTFCEACVKKMTKGSKLECPNCRKECNSKDIINDFRLEGFLQALKEQEDHLTMPKTETNLGGTGKCEFCEENHISHYCKDCNQWICASCKKIHSNAKLSKYHKIESLANKNEEFKTKLLIEINALKTKVKEHGRLIAAFETESDKTKAIQLSTLEESKRNRTRLHKEIDERFGAMDAKVLSNTGNYISQLNQAKEKYEEKYQYLDAQCNSIEKQVKENPQIAIEGNPLLRRTKELAGSTATPKAIFHSITVLLQPNRAMDISKAITIDIQSGSFEITVQRDRTRVSMDMSKAITTDMQTGSFEITESECILYNLILCIILYNFNSVFSWLLCAYIHVIGVIYSKQICIRHWLKPPRYID